MLGHGLIDAGAAVVVADRDEASVRRVADELRPQGTASALWADVSDEAACQHLIDHARTAAGGATASANPR